MLSSSGTKSHGEARAVVSFITVTNIERDDVHSHMKPNWLSLASFLALQSE